MPGPEKDRNDVKGKGEVLHSQGLEAHSPTSGGHDSCDLDPQQGVSPHGLRGMGRGATLNLVHDNPLPSKLPGRGRGRSQYSPTVSPGAPQQQQPRHTITYTPQKVDTVEKVSQNTTLKRTSTMVPHPHNRAAKYSHVVPNPTEQDTSTHSADLGSAEGTLPGNHPHHFYLTTSTSPHPNENSEHCLLYTSPSPRDLSTSRMPSSA